MLSHYAMRRTVAQVLPEFVKRFYRGALHGYRPPRSSIRLDLQPREDGLWDARIDSRVSFVADRSLLSDFEFYFERNGESVDEIAELLSFACGRGGLLLDVGAARGLFSIVFCRAANGNRAVAFEPSRGFIDTLDVLRERNEIGDRLTIRHCAVGRTPGVLRGSLAPSGFARFDEFEERVEELAVECVTLDDVCRELAVTPSIIKVDVEGMEDDVILGAEQMLRRDRPVILLELHHDLLRSRGRSTKMLIQWLADLGYRFREPIGSRLEPRQVYNTMAAVSRVVAEPC